MQFVPVEEFLAVRRPDRAVAVHVAVGGDARFRPAHLRAHEELVFARFVGEIGDEFAVRGPRGIQLVHAGTIGEVARASLFRGRRENIAASGEDRASARRREGVAFDVLGGGFVFRARLKILRMNLDWDLARFSRGQRVFVKQAAVFIDDGVRA